MLKKINEGTVENDSGFYVEITGPENMKYQEGKFLANIYWDYDTKIMKTHIYISKLKKWSNPVGAIIGNADKIRISKNVEDAMKLLKGDFEII